MSDSDSDGDYDDAGDYHDYDYYDVIEDSD